MNTMNNHPTNTLPGADDITREVLPNGITVLVRSNFNNPSVVINGYLNTGAIFDPDEKLGLANFTAAMLMRGTDQKNFNQIFEILESSGASLGFGGNIHTTSFSGKALIEDLPMLLGLLFEFIHSPTFPETYVEKMRAQLLTGLAMRAQDTAEMSSLAFDQLIFAGHPYSRPEDGYPETVVKITRDDIARYHKANFGPKGMVISVVGAIEANKAVDLVKSIFSNWSNPKPTRPTGARTLFRIIQIGQKENSHPGKDPIGCCGGLDCTSQKITRLHAHLPGKQHPRSIWNVWTDRGCDQRAIRIGILCLHAIEFRHRPRIMGSLCRGESGECGKNHRIGQKRDQAICHRTGFDRRAKRQPGELYWQAAIIDGIECRRGISPGQPGTVPVGVGLLSGLCRFSERSHS